MPKNVFRCMVQHVSFNSICSAPGVGLCKVASKPMSNLMCGGHMGDGAGCASCKFVIQSMGLYMERNLRPTVESMKRSICAVKFKTDGKLKKKVRRCGGAAVRRCGSSTACWGVRGRGVRGMLGEGKTVLGRGAELISTLCGGLWGVCEVACACRRTATF